jgi:CubicO group peptidase (beta-lactamase class C family)
MRKHFALFLLLLIFILPASGQKVSVKKIDQYIEKARKDWNVPGMAVAIVKDGEIILSKGYGVRELDKPEKVNENTQFAIASNTKAFVASALAKLVEEGKIDWKDKVRDYIPHFALYDEYTSTHATIEDLLCHRVGLGTFSGDVIWYKSEKPASEIIKQIQYVPQAYGFRDGYGYTNLMFITAGEVIKVVTGKPWDEYVKESFFQPLDMKNTVTSTNDLLPNNATPHKPTLKQGTIPIDWVNWDNMSSAGAIISSANDMAQWLMLNLNRGISQNDTLIPTEQQNLLWTPHNSFKLSESAKRSIPGRQFAGYGLGWGVMDYFGHMIVSHGGGYDGMYSRVAMMPDEKIGVVVLTNTMEGIATPLTYYIFNQFIEEDTRDWSGEYLEKAKKDTHHKDAVAERVAKRKEGTSTTHTLENYTGTYHDPLYGNITISKKGEQLRIDFEEAPLLSATLNHWHYDTFEIKWDEEHAWFDFGTVSFTLDNNLEVTGIEFDVPNDDIFFHELHPKLVNKK